LLGVVRSPRPIGWGEIREITGDFPIRRDPGSELLAQAITVAPEPTPRRPMRHLRPLSRPLSAVALLLGAGLLLGGCGEQAPAGSGSSQGGTHVMPDGSTMSDAEMKGMAGMDHGSADGHGEGEMDHGMDMAATSGPSAAAAMICSDEIAATVQNVFGLDEKPVPLDGWADRTYRCTWELPGGDLRMQVKDLTEAGPGRAWFDALQARLDARPIKGLQSLGFPAFETGSGDVGFLKDHKTLWVDASRVPASDLPDGMTRTEAAYGVAAAVVACWTE
jgi:hypothetical protein